MQILETVATEKSTYVITTTFRDEADNLVIPTSIAWTLTDVAGVVINSRDAVAVSVPASEVSIVLSGDDLAILAGGDTEARIFTVEAVYTSPTYGAGMLLKFACGFTVQNLEAV